MSVRPTDQLPHLLSDFHKTLWNLRSWCVNFAVYRILLSIEFYPCYASLDLEIWRQFSIHFVIANSPTWLIRSSWNFIHCKILIWRTKFLSPKRHNRGKTQWTIKSCILQSSHIMILNSTKFCGNRIKDVEVGLSDGRTDRQIPIYTPPPITMFLRGV
jgi:hypothetical protein